MPNWWDRISASISLPLCAFFCVDFLSPFAPVCGADIAVPDLPQTICPGFVSSPAPAGAPSSPASPPIPPSPKLHFLPSFLLLPSSSLPSPHLPLLHLPPPLPGRLPSLSPSPMLQLRLQLRLWLLLQLRQVSGPLQGATPPLNLEHCICLEVLKFPSSE